MDRNPNRANRRGVPARQPASKLKVKLYGERNTGTNYFSRLISLNFDVQLFPGIADRAWLQKHGATEAARDRFFAESFQRTLGWKHSSPPSRRELESMGVNTDRVLFVTITKNPYSWLLSLFKRPYHTTQRTESFSEFISAPWMPQRRENCSMEFRNPMDLWNIKNRAYVALFDSGLRVVNLRYEDLVSDPIAVLRRLSEIDSLRARHSDFTNVTRSTKDSEKDFDYYRDYYVNERWREKLPAADLPTINTFLDQHLMRRFDYSILESPSDSEVQQVTHDSGTDLPGGGELLVNPP